jgi:ketosteroid isomerase-like protein
MNRRDFLHRTLLTSGAIAITASTSGKFKEITSKQTFNFMTQSHPNLTLINDFFKAYAANDLDGIKSILSEDIKWHIPGNHPLSGTKLGVNQVLEFFRKLSKVALKAEPIIMGVNDKYVIDCHRNWSSIENEENLNSMSCLLWKIENNKIVEVFNFPQDQQVVDVFFLKLFKQ